MGAGSRAKSSSPPSLKCVALGLLLGFGMAASCAEDGSGNTFDYPDCTNPDNPSNDGHAGCRCEDIIPSFWDDPSLEWGRPDGAGSYLVHGLQGLGQYCRDYTGIPEDDAAVVCGKVERGTSEYAVCQVCGVDTNVGCPCYASDECEGVEDGLICWGSEEQGWAPSAMPGTCLPDPDYTAASGETGREALQEMPWFCLDNCESIDSQWGEGDTACLYNQDSDLRFEHGTCVDLYTYCDVEDNGLGHGYCEESGRRCMLDDNVDVCRPECVDDVDCRGLGFPLSYRCDFDEGFMYGHCVPPECAGSNVLEEDYCYLFR